MEATSSTEFVEWMAYLDDEVERGFHREDYLFAMVAAEIRKGNVKNPRSVKMKDFILDFSGKKKEEEHQALSLEERTARSKGFWFSVAGREP